MGFCESSTNILCLRASEIDGFCAEILGEISIIFLATSPKAYKSSDC